MEIEGQETLRLYQKEEWLKYAHQERFEVIRNKIYNEFSELIFDEEPHKYYLGEMELDCVSNVIHRFQEHFDSDKIAHKVYKEHFNDPNNKYYQMTVEEILQQWQDIATKATTAGSERHNFGESCFWFMLGEYDKIVPDFKDRLHQDEEGKYYMEAMFPKEIAIVRYWQDIPAEIVPILAENKVYDLDILTAGTFDILYAWTKDLKDENAPIIGLIIADYKTNVDLFKNYKEKRLLPPFDDLLDNSLNVYKLQLSTYQNCLEQIGLKVIARRLIWLRPTGKYEKINLETYTPKLRKAIIEKIKSGEIVPKRKG